MKIQLSPTDPLAGEADRLIMGRSIINRADLRIRIEYKDESGVDITIRKQDLIDALKAF